MSGQLGQERGAFTGTLSFTDAEGERTVSFSGIIGDDAKTLYLAGYEQGIGIGTLASSDELIINYVEPGSDAVAVSLLLEKVEAASSSDILMAPLAQDSSPLTGNGNVPPPTGYVN